MRKSHVLRPGNGPLHCRNGMLSIWSAFALVAVGLCAAAAINRGLLSAAWSQTRACADAAALAGCRALLSDELLLPGRSALDHDLQRCRDAAIALAAQHANKGRHSLSAVPALHAHQIDILQQVWSTSDRRYIAVSDSSHPDTVRVRLEKRVSSNASGGLVLVGSPGVNPAVLSCESTARLHDRIHGFQTGPGVAIPMAPFAIPNDTGQSLAGTWSATEEAGGQDDYSWDQGQREIRRQPDGLVELALTIHRTGSHAAPGLLVPVSICPSDHPTPFAERVRNGLKHSDASAAGLGLLTFPRSDTSDDLDVSDFQELEEVLSALIGEKRMFPLADLSTTTDVMLSDVVAARILAVRGTDSDQLHVLLQPTVMSTVSAVISQDHSVSRNRYVRKIALLR